MVMKWSAVVSDWGGDDSAWVGRVFRVMAVIRAVRMSPKMISVAFDVAAF
jgi:hypothetical protein